MVRHSGRHRQPDGRQPDERTPRGSDLAWNGWQQPRGRRALRLIAAVGTIAGGLCVVLAAMGLVVESGPRHPDSPGPPVGHAVLAISGRPDHPKKIDMPAGPGLYGVAWRFNCAPGQSGSLTLTRQSTTGSRVPEVTASGQHRQGVWWPRHSQAGQSLSIVSDCAWSAKIVKSVKTGAATPQPGNGESHKREHQHKTHENHGHPKRPKKNHVHEKKPKQRAR
jgi:hypothetical protein